MNDDEFWQVAFSFVPPTSVEKNRGEEEVDDVEFDLTSKRKVYKFRCEKTTARLALAPLPCDGGIMGPVGMLRLFLRAYRSIILLFKLCWR